MFTVHSDVSFIYCCHKRCYLVAVRTFLTETDFFPFSDLRSVQHSSVGYFCPIQQQSFTNTILHNHQTFYTVVLISFLSMASPTLIS